MIRQDINNLKNKCNIIFATDKCSLCHSFILSRHFYIFPCKHIFHSDCLLEQVSNQLSPNMLHQVKTLQHRIEKINANVAMPGNNNNNIKGSKSNNNNNNNSLGISNNDFGSMGLDGVMNRLTLSAFSSMGSGGNGNDNGNSDGSSQLNNIQDPGIIDDHNNNTFVSKAEILKNELDDIIAKECIFCSSLIIQSINKPFIDTKMDNPNFIKSWQL